MLIQYMYSQDWLLIPQVLCDNLIKMYKLINDLIICLHMFLIAPGIGNETAWYLSFIDILS